MQCKRTFTKRFILSSQKEIAPFYSNSNKKIRFVGSNSQVYCDKLQNRLSADFKQGTFFTKKQIAIVFNKTTIMYLFYLARLASITQKQELEISKISPKAIKHPSNKSLLVFTDFFTMNAHPYNPDKRSVSY